MRLENTEKKHWKIYLVFSLLKFGPSLQFALIDAYQDRPSCLPFKVALNNTVGSGKKNAELIIPFC